MSTFTVTESSGIQEIANQIQKNDVLFYLKMEQTLREMDRPSLISTTSDKSCYISDFNKEYRNYQRCQFQEPNYSTEVFSIVLAFAFILVCCVGFWFRRKI